MITRLLLPVLLVALSLQQGQACSCFGPPTFCQTLNPPYAEPQWWLPSDIVLAVIQGDHHYAADVKVVQVFSGDLQAEQLIRVWGDCGLLCRHYVTGNIGDTVLWALQHCDLSGNGSCGTSFEESQDYQLSACGVYWLGYANGLVSGPITQEGATQTMPLAEFGALVNGCLSTGIREEQPVDVLTVRYEGGIPVIAMSGVQGRAQLSVLDALGRCVQSRGWDGMRLALEGFCSGGYLVLVEQEMRQVQRKVIMP